MKFLLDIIQKVDKFISKKPFLKKFHPLIEATEEFFFATSKTTPSAPHIRDRIDIKRYMSMVIIALLPATLAGIYFYGLRVVAIIAVSYIFGGLTEVAFSVIRRKPIYEGFLVTGLIFPLILPPTIPLWMVAVGVIFGVFFGKEVFGGTGRNIFNPALVGRVFLSLAFPEYFASFWQVPFLKGAGGFIHYTNDTITSATPLINFKTSHSLAGFFQLFLGSTPGSVGETFRLGIILGGLFLILIRIVDWRLPLSYLLSLVGFSFVLSHFFPQKVAPAMFQLLSGGVLFGAFFMATDPVTAPFTLEARWIAGILLGVLTVCIRSFSGFVEGVMFAILLVNALTPLIDEIVVNLRFKNIPLER